MIRRTKRARFIFQTTTPYNYKNFTKAKSLLHSLDNGMGSLHRQTTTRSDYMKGFWNRQNVTGIYAETVCNVYGRRDDNLEL